MGLVFPLYGPRNPRSCAVATLLAVASVFALSLAGLYAILLIGLPPELAPEAERHALPLGGGIIIASITAYRHCRSVKWTLREYGCRSAFRFLRFYVIQPPLRVCFYVALPIGLFLSLRAGLPRISELFGGTAAAGERLTAQALVWTVLLWLLGFLVVRLVQHYRGGDTWNPVVRGRKLGTIAGINSWLGEKRAARDSARLDRILKRVAETGGTDSLPASDHAFLVEQSRKAAQARKRRR